MRDALSTGPEGRRRETHTHVGDFCLYGCQFVGIMFVVGFCFVFYFLFLFSNRSLMARAYTHSYTHTHTQTHLLTMLPAYSDSDLDSFLMRVCTSFQPHPVFSHPSVQDRRTSISGSIAEHRYGTLFQPVSFLETKVLKARGIIFPTKFLTFIQLRALLLFVFTFINQSCIMS